MCVCVCHLLEGLWARHVWTGPHPEQTVLCVRELRSGAWSVSSMPGRSTLVSQGGLTIRHLPFQEEHSAGGLPTHEQQPHARIGNMLVTQHVWAAGMGETSGRQVASPASAAAGH